MWDIQQTMWLKLAATIVPDLLQCAALIAAALVLTQARDKSLLNAELLDHFVGSEQRS